MEKTMKTIFVMVAILAFVTSEMALAIPGAKPLVVDLTSRKPHSKKTETLKHTISELGEVEIRLPKLNGPVGWHWVVGQDFAKSSSRRWLESNLFPSQGMPCKGPGGLCFAVVRPREVSIWIYAEGGVPTPESELIPRFCLRLTVHKLPKKDKLERLRALSESDNAQLKQLPSYLDALASLKEKEGKLKVGMRKEQVLSILSNLEFLRLPKEHTQYHCSTMHIWNPKKTTTRPKCPKCGSLGIPKASVWSYVSKVSKYDMPHLTLLFGKNGHLEGSLIGYWWPRLESER